ncbi:MAG: hypothetical protein EOO20_03545 [Chryseobacterium sp.]|nr:MAG: hypothetical protein EOO20_03545 [Chryseobacterium sp.]
MIEVTVLAMIGPKHSALTPVEQLMNERLLGLVSDLQGYLNKVFAGERTYEELVIYMGYNAKYGVQWKIVNDVSVRVSAEVSKCCTNLGYLEWREPET